MPEQAGFSIISQSPTITGLHQEARLCAYIAQIRYAGRFHDSELGTNYLREFISTPSAFPDILKESHIFFFGTVRAPLQQIAITLVNNQEDLVRVLQMGVLAVSAVESHNLQRSFQI